MRLVLALIVIMSLGIASCSIEHHLSKAQKHIDIAKRKGAVIKPDTVWHYSYTLDTVWNEKTHAYETRHMVKDSFPYFVTNTISAGMTRQERLLMESYFKHMEKMMKLQNDSLAKALKAEVKKNRQTQKTQRVIERHHSIPWKLMFFVFVLFVALYVFYRIFYLKR